MTFHILTLFPDMVKDGLSHSVINRAVENGIIKMNYVDIRDFSNNKHGHVDDYPYGGGPGMVMKPGPIYRAYKSLSVASDTRVLHMTPKGKLYNNDMANELSKEKELVILCGHYEGIDERVIDEIVTDEISIGDYILTGGEIPAMAIVDSVSRLLAGTLNNEESSSDESFSNGLLEYPQYTRPYDFMGRKVPDVLLSGNHGLVEKWRFEKSVSLTKENRPDIYRKYIEGN